MHASVFAAVFALWRANTRPVAQIHTARARAHTRSRNDGVARKAAGHGARLSSRRVEILRAAAALAQRWLAQRRRSRSTGSRSGGARAALARAAAATRAQRCPTRRPQSPEASWLQAQDVNIGPPVRQSHGRVSTSPQLCGWGAARAACWLWVGRAWRVRVRHACGSAAHRLGLR